MIAKDDFAFVCKLLKDEAAISLENGKEYLVESRLAPVAKEHGFVSIERFLEHIRTQQGTIMRQLIVEALTTHETSFFRDVEPFDMLRAHILPRILERKRDQRTLTIWCGAASSGQEPYTLCMVLKEHFPELLGWKVDFLATDISSKILQKAKSGRYSQLEVNRGLPARLLVKYFERDGVDWVIRSDIRAMVRFGEANLLKDFNHLPKCDLIFLRNVLIYFEAESKKKILEKVRSLLYPDSYLFLGTAETTINLDENFERISFDRTSCYRKLR